MAHDHNNANPAPLGLMGFGMTTVLLNLHNAQIVPMGAAIMAMGLVFGGVTQFTAGVLEYRNDNTFGMTAFMGYGAFWLSLVVLLCLPQWGLAPASAPALLGSYMWIWGLFTAIMAVGSLVASRMHQVVFFSLTVLFVLLGSAEIFARPILTLVAGYEGLLCGFSAIYLAAAEILEAQFDRPVLPTGLPSGPTAQRHHDDLLVQLS
ncbi:acetate uptake transporter [Komagataeibacter kakiaceti JCM 25156]|uniref:acetate uptake transporter n=1 Tax=Komagataeibacter kakiaceti TaxID=943261 RepID=UPI000472A717|nr:GPR1/FUN34/YaaH family transporter [Komagataeibacter kakiaceti]